MGYGFIYNSKYPKYSYLLVKNWLKFYSLANFYYIGTCNAN